MSLALKNAGELMTLYFGGYKRPKVLGANLIDMIRFQNHTAYGAIKLATLWPGIQARARECDEQRKAEARNRSDELIKRTVFSKNPLLERVKKSHDAWYSQSITFGSLGEHNEPN